jgi:penicillin-binding protein 1A
MTTATSRPRIGSTRRYASANWCPQNYSHSFSGSMTLTQAITRLDQRHPVRLSVSLGDGNPKIGPRQDHPDRAAHGHPHALPGLHRRCRSAPRKCTILGSLPPPTATFPNLGKAVAPQAVLEVRSGNGEVVWRFDRDGKKPVQVLRPQVALDMNFMMNKVVEEGTGARRCSTASSRPARPAPPTPIATPGSSASPATMWRRVVRQRRLRADQPHDRRLAAGMTWRQIMAYAHQGIEIKPLPGVAPGPTGAAPQVAARRERRAGSRARPC